MKSLEKVDMDSRVLLGIFSRYTHCTVQYTVQYVQTVGTVHTVHTYRTVVARAIKVDVMVDTDSSVPRPVVALLPTVPVRGCCSAIVHTHTGRYQTPSAAQDLDFLPGTNDLVGLGGRR